jgi:thiamine biosynthesis lipoprotein
MVKGVDAGAILALQAGLDALFLKRDDTGGVQGIGVGKLFSNKSAATAPAVGD